MPLDPALAALVGRGPTSTKNGRLGDTVRVGFVPVVLDL